MPTNTYIHTFNEQEFKTLGLLANNVIQHKCSRTRFILSRRPCKGCIVVTIFIGISPSAIGRFMSLKLLFNFTQDRTAQDTGDVSQSD